MHAIEVRVKRILTRAGGYLRDVCSHSLQPYRGCSFGRSLCGVACYVHVGAKAKLFTPEREQAGWEKVLKQLR